MSRLLTKSETSFLEPVLVGTGFIILLISSPWLTPWPALLYLCAWVAWHGFQMYLFMNWMRHPKRAGKPQPIGIWREILYLGEKNRKRGKKRKKQLRKILGGFKQTSRALPDATIVLSEDYSIEWGNKAATEVLGYRKNLHVHQPVFSLIDDKEFKNYLINEDYSAPIQIQSGQKAPATIEIRVVAYGKGKFLIQARDISRLNQLEVMRRDFVANVSHELRTPLTVIHGYLETLIDTTDSDELEDWKPVFEQMQGQSNRLQRIVEDLLALSRLESENFSPPTETVNVSSIVERIAKAAESISGEDQHQISVDCNASVGLKGSAVEIESAFSNIVFNAVRYTPKGGHIHLRWGLEGNSPVFSVTDTGIGIEESHLPRLTERFYRVDVGRSRENGGTGLGLAIVKHILLGHNAKLRVESILGKGSVFSCEFGPKSGVKL